MSPKRSSSVSTRSSPASSSSSKRSSPGSAGKAAKTAKVVDGAPGTIGALFRQAKADELPPPPPDFEQADDTAKPVTSSTTDSTAERLVPAVEEPPAPAPLSADEEAELKAFDLDPKFGPCIGPTRLNRWRLAQGFDLDPPARVLAILERFEGCPDDEPALKSTFAKKVCWG